MPTGWLSARNGSVEGASDGLEAASDGTIAESCRLGTDVSDEVKRKNEWKGERQTGHLSRVSRSKQSLHTQRWRHGSRMVSRGSVKQAMHSGEST